MPSQHGSVTETAAQKKHRLAGIRAQWDSQHFLPLAQVSPEELAATIHTVFAPSLEMLSKDQIDKLSRMLAEQLVARAANIADPYMTLAQSDPNTRPITHEDSWDWSRLESMYKYMGQPMPMPNDVDVWGIFRDFVTTQLETNHGMLIGAADQAPGGFRVDVYKIHAPDEIDYYLFQNLDEDQMSYWFENNGQRAFQVRIPRMSLKDILKRDHNAIIVNICWLVQTEDHQAFNWHTTWYWDPKSKSWVCNRIARKGWHGYMYY